MIEATFGQALIMGLMVGLASGSIGSFIILRRMALVGDALSHVALPGIAIALFYKLDPFWGVLVFLIAAALLIWWLEEKSKLPIDALAGLLFTASLAIGILTIPDAEILESLFGAFPVLSVGVLLVVLGVACLATVFIFLLARKFLFFTISPEVAKVSGVSRKYDLLLFLIFSVVVTLGIKLVGTLLMGALTIIPAAVAKNISRSMGSYMILSTLLGGMISVIGVLISHKFGFLPGPVIILSGIAIFLFSLLLVRK